MYLQRIELQGFKSFANKTVLEFPAPTKVAGRGLVCGITAIVGPNGSGKSNIVDAVRWVLGEQSLKLLRGKKATDIIFAGSSKKAQLSMAEVSLHLNNEDGSAPVDYSELVITRKLYRDGTSEYLLNKSEVRLFDIIMLLAKANFGQNTYSVIGQGMVDKIVNYSGQERKEFFDEATGVKQYQIKRDRSVSKLKRSRDHITQVSSLLVELDPHLKNLTRQVERLHKRQAIETELRGLQETYYQAKWGELTNQYNQSAQAHTDQEKKKITSERALEDLQERFTALSTATSRTAEFDRLQADYNSIIERKNKILKELSVIKGRLEVEYSASGQQNLAWLERRRDELQTSQRQAEQDVVSLENKAKQEENKKDRLTADLNNINAELTVAHNNLQQAQEELYGQHSQQRYPAAAESARALMNVKEKISGIYGSIGDLAKVDQRYESALSAAAGNRLWAVVVESDQVAVQAINYLKEKRLAPVTFFPLNTIKFSAGNRSSYGDGVIGYALDLLTYDKRFAPVFEFVFGSTLVVQDVEAAREYGIGRERMVTMDGDMFEKTGTVRGGYTPRGWLRWLGLGGAVRSTGPDMVKLKDEVEQKQRRKEEINADLNNISLELRLSAERQVVLNKAISDYQQQLKQIEREINQEQLTPEQQKEQIKTLAKERDDYDRELNELIAGETQARQALDAFNTEQERKQQESFTIQQEMHQQQLVLNQIVSALGEISVELAKIETRREDILTLMRQDLGEDYRPTAKNEAKIDAIDFEEQLTRINKLKKQLELIGGTDPEIEKEYHEVKERYDHLHQQSTDLVTAIKDMEKIVVELDKMIKKQFDDEFTKINRDFSRYFKQLFEGGSAKLLLVQKEVTEAEVAREELAESEVDGEIASVELVAERHIEDRSELANMGIEIEACPPGKKIKNISVLSGGEKTMTALALVCAIIANNPSPFILFDEVDAALDESNSSKLSGIIEELSHQTQFIVITHNRAVMARGDVLYGVTMQGDGISRLLGLKLDQAEKMAQE